MTTAAPALETVVGTWTIDPAHSTVGFAVKHAMVTTVRGKFTDFAGSIEVTGENAATVQASVKTGSIDTGQDGRDQHLRSADFFDAEQFPEMTFTSTAIEDVDDDEFVLVGDLTIKGTTRSVRFEVEAGGVHTDQNGALRAGFEAKTTINRSDFGLTWNVALETGGFLVSEKIKIVLDISAVKA